MCHAHRINCALRVCNAVAVTRHVALPGCVRHYCSCSETPHSCETELMECSAEDTLQSCVVSHVQPRQPRRKHGRAQLHTLSATATDQTSSGVPLKQEQEVMSVASKTEAESDRNVVRALARVAWETKGEDIVALDVQEQSSWCRCAVGILLKCIMVGAACCCRCRNILPPLVKSPTQGEWHNGGARYAFMSATASCT